MSERWDERWDEPTDPDDDFDADAGWTGVDERIALLVTAVVAADGEDAARDACTDFVWQVGGLVVEVGDCAAEEPGCWAVTVRCATDERTTHQAAAPLARAVRRFVRALGPDVAAPRVACEPPTAWTVLDDPAVLDELVPGAERLLIEAWCGGDPLYPASPQPVGTDANPDADADAAADVDTDAEDPDELTGADEVADEPDRRPPAQTRTLVAEPPKERGGQHPTGPWPGPDPSEDAGCRLSLRVDVATAREAGAEWQARAVASRISRSVTVTGTVAKDGVLSVRMDLGPSPQPPSQTVLTAVSALDRRGWAPLRWEGDTASTRWVAQPRPASGITELELSSGPAGARRRR